MRHAPLTLTATACAGQLAMQFLALSFLPKTRSHPEMGHAGVHGAIAEATSPEASEVEPTAEACGPKDNPGSCADLATFGTTLFQVMLTPRLDGSTNSEGKENVLISPLSVGQALALVSAGATPGSTCEAELLDVLGIHQHSGVPLLTDALLASAKTTSTTAKGWLATAKGKEEQQDTSSGVSLTTYLTIWLGGSIKASYEERAEIVHHATAKPLPQTYATINEWVEVASNREIQNLFDGSQVVNPLTRAILVNVVYFKGTWTEPFDKSKTEVGVFYKTKSDRESKEKVDVKYMKDRRHVLLHPANEGLGGAIVMKLDYGPVGVPSKFAALFVLPKDDTVESERAALDGLVKSSVTELIQGLQYREVNLSLPKFKLDFGTSSLVEALRSMGLNAMFDGTKVLSEMSDDPDLHVDEVLHKAVMEVTEEGTTASAATAITVLGSACHPTPPMDLQFDRPFFAMVVHVETGTPLFLGRVGDPKEDGVERRNWTKKFANVLWRTTRTTFGKH